MMMSIEDLLQQAESLSAVEKWKLVKHVLQSLEQEQMAQPEEGDWHEFLRSTYGSLKDTPIRRWDQGEYEERESLE